MSLSENYQCDVCGTKKTETGQWWLMSVGACRARVARRISRC